MYLPSTDPAVFLRQALEELRQLHEAGAGGHELARRRADVIDLVLISLFREAEQRAVAGGRLRESGVAVLAVGGYGRRELCPYSDVDLMLLYDPEEQARVQEVAESLFYPLWDAGLELGHGARTVEECLSVAAESLETETALLQTRFLVGDQELFRELSDRLRARVTADGGEEFVSRLLQARDTRHSEFGASASLLEPHFKEGRGGLRDVHELLWACLGLRGGGGLEALAAAGWLPADALVELEGAVEVLLRARTGLHYLAGRKVDRLYLDFQEEFAALMAAPATGSVPVVMAGITDAAHSVAFLTGDAWEALLRELGLTGRRPPAVLPARMPESPEGRRILLLELLREGADGLPRLERLSHRRILSVWLPGWEDIRSLGQRDNLHTYTVDGHAFRCVATAVDLATTGGPDPFGAALASELALSPDWEGFLLACLLHDLGKGVDGADHADAGAELAAEAAARLGEPPETCAEISFLVRHHLLLVDTATRRDLDDSFLLGRLADRIATRRRLEMLYVLTVSDSMATGPASWTPWTAALVRDLFFKLLRLIEGLELPAVTGARLEEERRAYEEALAGLPDRPPGDVTRREHLLHLTISGGPAGEVLLQVHEGPVEGVQELAVTSPPYGGLLTRLCGVLTYHGVNIMGAQFQPVGDGLLARSFQVADYFGHAVPRERWELVARDLSRALEGPFALGPRLAEKRARYRQARGAGRSSRSRVVMDNSASDILTVIEVHADDRIGLLYTIARTLDELLLDVKLAKVSTLKEQVVDVFYVADARGEKIADREHLEEIERAILFALREER